MSTVSDALDALTDLQPDRARITADILHGLARHLLGSALHPVVKRQAALDPRQHQQLLKSAVHAVGALLGVLECLLAYGAVGHACHLQVRLDRGQRAAQLMGSVVGQAPLALKGLGDALEQLILELIFD